MTTDPQPAKPTDGPAIAFVLAGGGTKGAFEVGAITYLVSEADLVPDIIAATSAGTILAGVLAQARTGPELRARAGELRDDLLAMTRTDLLFAKQPWLADFDGTPFGALADAFISDRTRPAPPAAVADLDDPSAPPRPKHRRLHSLTAVLEALPSANQARKDYPDGPGSLLTLDPLERALKGSDGSGDSPIRPIDPQLVARPGLTLRLGITALGAGTTRYVCEDGTIVDRDGRTPLEGEQGGPIDVRDGILASSTVPMIFEPRPLAGDVYVDGGVLQNIPVEVAARLGAQRLIAVLAVPLEQPPDPRDFTKVNFAGIFVRASGAISFAETQRTNLAYPLADGQALDVIDPTVDVVGPFEVEQGLMLIDMDYGWLRAADVLAELDDATRVAARETSDAITVGRETAWYLEESLWTAPDDPDPTMLERVRSAKDEVRGAVERRRALGAPVPAGADTWSTTFETHRTPPPDALHL